MEYLKNGDFREDLEDRENGWTVDERPGPVVRVGDVGQYDRSNFVHFAGNGHLSQSVSMSTSRPDRLALSLGIKVQGGSAKPDGKVQVIVTVDYASGLPGRHTYYIQEFDTWQTARIPLPISEAPVAVSLVFLVVATPETVVNLRQISLTDDQIQGAIEGKKHDADHPIRDLIEKLIKKVEELGRKIEKLTEK